MMLACAVRRGSLWFHDQHAPAGKGGNMTEWFRPHRQRGPVSALQQIMLQGW